ncbi:hypothetical protein TYRP_020618 [Tyrophagus putrescentiae]|nr:hypothetical protein TYRP_020618 [Tyrophagus putrescentiae]
MSSSSPSSSSPSSSPPPSPSSPAPFRAFEWPRLSSLVALSDYLLWVTLYRLLPHRLVTWAFLLFTTIQLYWLATKYLLVELHRKLSRRVRNLGGRTAAADGGGAEDIPDIPERLPPGYVAVVTGGSRGIGLSVATELYRRGATVVVTAHGLTPPEREQLAERIRNGEKVTAEKNCGDGDGDACDKNEDKTSEEGRLHIYQIDLRDLGAVCRFAEHLTDRFGGRLNLLVNNAGVMYVPLAYTEDGFEEHYQVNYLAHALLTWLLLPALQRGGDGSSSTGPRHTHPSRIVNVSSSTHYAPPTRPTTPTHSPKLAILMHTYWLAEWLKEHENQEDNPPSVLVNTLHPGVVNTALYENVWWEGAETVLYAALSTQVDSGGGYYEDCRRVRSSRFSYRRSIQRRLAAATAAQLNPVIEAEVNGERRRRGVAPVPLMYHYHGTPTTTTTTTTT